MGRYKYLGVRKKGNEEGYLCLKKCNAVGLDQETSNQFLVYNNQVKTLDYPAKRPTWTQYVELQKG